MKVIFAKPNKSDFLEFGDIISERIKIIVESDGNTSYTFMEKKEFEKLGVNYITKHAKLLYSNFLEDYYVNISQNDYYNDLTKYPEKTIKVDYMGEDGTYQIYKDKSRNIIYTREVSSRESFARWLSHGKKIGCDSGLEIRPNLIFMCAGQKEKVIYDDWNGVAAYSATFNKNFNKGVI